MQTNTQSGSLNNDHKGFSNASASHHHQDMGGAGCDNDKDLALRATRIEQIVREQSDKLDRIIALLEVHIVPQQRDASRWQKKNLTRKKIAKISQRFTTISHFNFIMSIQSIGHVADWHLESQHAILKKANVDVEASEGWTLIRTALMVGTVTVPIDPLYF